MLTVSAMCSLNCRTVSWGGRGREIINQISGQQCRRMAVGTHIILDAEIVRLRVQRLHLHIDWGGLGHFLRPSVGSVYLRGETQSIKKKN